MLRPGKPTQIDFVGHRFDLMPTRALHWHTTDTLLIADPHLGKDSLFVARGVPMPDDVSANDLSRLSAIVGDLGVHRLMILGDLFHGRESVDDRMVELLSRFRDRHPTLTIMNVRGNHDRHAGDAPDSLGCIAVDEHVEAGLRFVHDPTGPTDLPTLGGHLHPGASVGDFDRRGATLPCFVVEPTRLILPAFGRFTGCISIPPAPGRRRFVAGYGRVVEVGG
jgi:uncharacterized protein